MGLFDGVLFCSDIDGTLVEGTSVSRENLAAIEEFKREGGHFVIATGRYADYPEQELHLFSSDPLISLNGTLIVAGQTHEPLVQFPLTPPEVECASLIAHSGWDYIDCAVLHWMDHHICYRTPEALECAMQKAMDAGETIYKVVFTTRGLTEAPALRAMGQERLNGRATFCMTWSTGVELYRADAGKAACMRHLQKLLPNIITTVAAGDYENDVQMIAAADYGYAPAGAAPAALQAARFWAPSCRDNAIAYIIDDLKQKAKAGTLLPARLKC